MAGHRLRVFLDSNVVFSGLYSSVGAPAAILDAFAAGDLSVVVSSMVLEEVVRATKAKAPRALPALGLLLANSPLEVVANPAPDGILPWRRFLSAGDAAVLAAAISARVDYLVSGDRHFTGRRIAVEGRIRIVTPAQLLAVLRKPRS